ncbi:MAG: hypothetical protein II008_19135 [Oscillospiraceae bacterium]|nr:hypothetical protein [Oscillospiraceae bacterium]
MQNPMESLPAYGAILKAKCKLKTSDDPRCPGDLIAAVLDRLIGDGWSYLGLWPKEAASHRQGSSILELQTFLDWAMGHLIEDMEWNVDELDKIAEDAITEFFNRPDEEENEA